jgi:heme exporter protein D
MGAMSMQWASWSAFFNMGGYAFYVWFSFGFTVFCIGCEILSIRNRKAAARRLSQLLGQD